MAKVYSFEGVTPVVDPSAYVHPDAVLIGDVIVGPGCYVAAGAVLRGDFGRIVMERESNLQDNCVVHSGPGFDCVMEERAHVGHGAVIHYCRIGRDALVGMNAVVMDKAVVGESAIVAAMSFVKAGMQVPPRVLVAGVPGKVVRELTDADVAGKRVGTAMYVELARRCLAGQVPAEPLAAVAPGRGRTRWGPGPG
jgi:phenylacetic acid degradation protein